MSLLFSCFTCVVMAQSAAPPAPPAAGPTYVSPFADYRRFDAESPSKPWRLANDEVREAGGHVGIVKGLSSPAAATAVGKSPSGGEAPKANAPNAPGKPAAKPGAPGHSHGSHR